MMNIKLINALFATLLVISVNAQTKVFYVELKEGKEITGLPIKEHEQSGEAKGGQEIYIYPDVGFQEITGVGGAFNEIGGLALMSLPQENREEVMRNLFSKKGAHFSFCRTGLAPY